jgi:hypothetical protein
VVLDKGGVPGPRGGFGAWVLCPRRRKETLDLIFFYHP